MKTHRFTVIFTLLTVVSFCCVSIIHAVGNEQQSSPLVIDVYYESMCIDSINFITKTLAPAYENLMNFVKVNFVPFGKASWVVGNENHTTEFSCQHGPRECLGNRAQACVLYEIERSLKPEDQQQKMVDVIECVMSQFLPHSSVPYCAEIHGLSAESIEFVKNCTRNNLGNELLIANGEKTKALKSPLSFVPSISINGKLEPEAYTDFSKVICRLISAEQKPSVCRN